MDFRHIDAFRAVMLTGTSTKAAQLIGSSQSAVSRLVSDLERSTGLVLFNRERGRLEPTNEAQLLFDEVQRRYAGLDDLKEFALRLRNVESALRVGSVQSFGLGLFAKAIAQFRTERPNTQVILETGRSDQIRDQVVARGFSLGVVSDGVELAETDATPFCTLEPICALPAGHPLCSAPYLEPKDLKGQSIISYRPEHMIRWGIEDLLRQEAIESSFPSVLRYSVNVCTLVRENIGVGLVHPVAAYEFLHAPDIVFKRFVSDVRFNTLLIKHHTPSDSALVDAMYAALRTSLDSVIKSVTETLDASAR